MHRVLARLPRYAPAARSCRNINNLRTYALHTQQLQEAQKPQEDRRDTQNADATVSALVQLDSPWVKCESDLISHPRVPSKPPPMGFH